MSRLRRAMQDSLFPEDDDDEEPPVEAAGASPAASTDKPAPRARRAETVEPAPADPADTALRSRLPPRVRLGTSSWNYPGWSGLVWQGEHSAPILSRRGLPAYAQHPLFAAVSLDRAFYRPLTAAQYAEYAAAVPQDFRFVVKAPSVVTDALVRSEDGRGMQANAAFLDAHLAVESFAQPALEGLGQRLGALVFQLSPLPPALLGDLPGVVQRLDVMLAALPPLHAEASDAVVAVEVRDPEWLADDVRPAFVAAMKRHGATFCLGLHAKMPPIDEQLQVLRELWPGPLVCRWNLHRKHGSYGYEDAKKLYEPFDRLVDPDPHVRAVLAKVANATATAGHPVTITVSNKAEGSAPLTVRALAEAIAPPVD